MKEKRLMDEKSLIVKGNEMQLSYYLVTEADKCSISITLAEDDVIEEENTVLLNKSYPDAIEILYRLSEGYTFPMELENISDYM